LQLPFDVRQVHVASVVIMVLARNSLNMAMNISLVQIVTGIRSLSRQRNRRKHGCAAHRFMDDLFAAEEDDNV